MNLEQSTPFTRHLGFPFGLLRVGSLPMLLYVIAVAIICVGIVEFLELQSARFLTTVQHEEQLSNELYANLYLFCQIVSWLIVLPALIASQALPVRLIFLHDKFPLVDTIKHSLGALKLAIRGIYYSLRWAPIYFVPLLAVLLLERLLQDFLVVPLYSYAYYGVALIVAFGVVIRVLPFLLLPITCVLSLADERYAHYQIQRIFNKESKVLIALTALVCSASVFLPRILPSQVLPYQYVGQLVLCYYFVLVISCLITRELAVLAVDDHRQQHRA